MKSKKKKYISLALCGLSFAFFLSWHFTEEVPFSASRLYFEEDYLYVRTGTYGVHEYIEPGKGGPFKSLISYSQMLLRDKINRNCQDLLNIDAFAVLVEFDILGRAYKFRTMPSGHEEKTTCTRKVIGSSFKSPFLWGKKFVFFNGSVVHSQRHEYEPKVGSKVRDEDEYTKLKKKYYDLAQYSMNFFNNDRPRWEALNINKQYVRNNFSKCIINPKHRAFTEVWGTIGGSGEFKSLDIISLGKNVNIECVRKLVYEKKLKGTGRVAEYLYGLILF